jgi:hypothetical protein
MQAICQGDVILLPVQQGEEQKIPHLTFRQGNFMGHKHCITEGKAEI